MADGWTRVEQRDGNDCWNAAVASLFGLDYDDVAHLPRGDGSDPAWHRVWTEWFAERGFAWWERPLPESASRYVGFGEVAIVSCESPRTEGDHCVLMRGGEILWDPHRDRADGVGRPRSVAYLIPLEPALLRTDGCSPV